MDYEDLIKCSCGIAALVKEESMFYCATCWIRKKFNFFEKEIKDNAYQESVRNRQSNNC